MTRSSTFWRLTTSLIAVLFSLFTHAIDAKNAPILRGGSSEDLIDIRLFATKTSARVGDLVSIEVTTSNFAGVEEMTLPVGWNPALLTFQSVSGLSTDISSFSNANFSTTNTATGLLIVNWMGTPSTIADGERFFTINFRVAAYSGLPAGVIFTNLLGGNELSIKTAGSFPANVMPSNGSVRIIDNNPCPPRPAGLTCQTAPILNASEFPYYSTLPFQNRLTVPTRGTVCPGGSIENNHWVAFIAASTAVSIKVAAGNCFTGIQYFVYETADCDDFQKIACRSTAIPSGAEDISDLTGLVVGNKYYIMVDGAGGDICDYKISITGGQVYNATQAISAQTITGPSTICGNRTGLTYTIPTVNNADAYIWRIPSSATATTPTSGAAQTSITVNWGTVSDSVCVKIASKCDTTKWFCKSVKAGIDIVKDTTVTSCAGLPYLFDGVERTTAGNYRGFFRSVSGCDSTVNLKLILAPNIKSEFTVTKCLQDPYNFGGVDRYSEGSYDFKFKAVSGCDSTVTLRLFNYPLATKSIDTTICVGTSIIVGGQTFRLPYNSTVNVPRGSYLGCDSSINLKLTVIDFLLPTPLKNNNITCELPQATLTSNVQNQPSNAILTYEWKNASGTIVGTTPSVSVNQAGVFTLTVTASVNGKLCSKSTSIDVTKTGNQPSKPTIAGAAKACVTASEVYTLPALVANATSYNWTVSNGTFPAAVNNQITATWNASATASKVCVNAQNACGISDSACVSVEIGRIPAPLSIAGSTTICPNASLTYRVPTNPNTTFLWSVTGGTAQNALTTDSLRVLWTAANGTVTVTPSSRCGTGTPTTLSVVTSNILPDSLPIGGNTTPCSNDTTIYTVAASANTTSYLWQVPTGANILSGQGTRTINVIWGSFTGNGDVFLTTKNACQLGRGVSLPVVVKNAVLPATVINGSRTVCPSTQISFSTPKSADIRSYAWTVPADATILRGATSDSIRVDWGTSPSDKVCLDVESTCGVRRRTCIDVEVRADLDSLVIASNTVVCKDSTLKLCVPDDGSTLRFLWQIPNITGGTIVSGQGTSCVNIKFTAMGGTVRVIPVGGCADGKISRQDVVVKSTPTITSVITGKTTACNNSVETFSVAAQANISRYAWRLPTGVTALGDSTGNSITVSIGNTASSGFMTVQAQNDCGFGNGVTTLLTISQRPKVNAGVDTLICGLATVLNGSSNGSVKTWSVVTKPVGSVVNFAFSDRSRTTVTVSKSGIYTFRFEESNNGDCAVADSVTVTFRDLPTATMVDQTCNQEATEYRVQLNITGAGAPFSLGGSTIGTFQGSSFLSNVIPSGTPYFFVITDALGCKSDTVRGNKICPCYSSAGNLKSDSIIVCFGTTGKATPQGDAKLDLNDVSEYVLHTGTATRIGNILTRNKTGIFAFDPNLVIFNRVYYVTFIVGDQLANGSVDTSKRCVSRTRGVPIIFKDRFTAGLVGDTTVCRFSPISLLLKTNQTGFYEISYQANDGNAVFVPDIQNNARINLNPALSATYRLLSVVNKDGCKAEIADSARVNLYPLPISNAGVDRSICNATVQLDAAENFSYLGKWTSLTSGTQIADSANARTVVTRLQNGRNVFIWTVQDTGCLDYSVRDTVIIFLPLLPKAINLSLITQVGVPVSGNVSESAPQGTYSVTRLTNPTSGRFDLFSNGTFTYLPEAKFEGIVTFKYTICSDLCTQLCDTGMVRILIQPKPDSVVNTKIDVPNAITPNDDGKNDALVIDGIDRFAENELVIFNRWGDILYQSKPYNNDWRGTNKNGDALPEGTYYYVLRLNTADGKILRGDMTILR